VTSPLRILLLEDDPTDAALIQELLEADNIACEVTRAQTRAEYLSGLEDAAIGLILADYKLPSFDGLSALKLAQNVRPGLPFIFVSGSLGEEVAIEALKIGATDYVLKSRLSRLAPSVKRALREAGDRAQRKRAEDALRRSEMYLAEAQRLSHTGSFGWEILSGEIYWSDETYRIFEIEPTIKPTVQIALERTHPDDRPYLREVIERVALERRSFSAEHRLRMPDGSVKHVQIVARHAASEDPERVLFIGAVTDITERKRAEQQRERLRQLEGDLAHINRVSTMGELAASLAHEIKQPIAAIATKASAVLRWLHREPPEIEEACQSASSIINDSDRAVHIVDRNRALYSRETTQRELIDLNEIIREMVDMLRDTAYRHSISIRSDLDAALPAVNADRVQLQQVLMNLMLNGIEAMKEESGELSVTSTRTEDGELLIAVSDCGIGLPEAGPERIFEAFFTTKPNGTGMGLSISRRIIESHGGRLWASANAGRGATFQFALPMEQKSVDHQTLVNRVHGGDDS
jgi:signal transduction histidine kinase/FixJ family two-component response regulator